jgi:hypothetical protein
MYLRLIKGTATGDPHISGFYGVTLTHHYAIAQHLFLHQDLNIQEIQSPCNGRAYCATAIAVRYGSSVFVVDVRNNDYFAHQVTPNVDGVTYAQALNQGIPTYHTFNLPDGSYIQANIAKSGAVSYLNIYIWISPAYHSLNPAGTCPGPVRYGGACGRMHGKANYIYPRASAPVGINSTNIAKHMSSWIIKDSENLFNGFVPGSVPKWRSSFKNPLPSTLTIPSAPVYPSLTPYTGQYKAARELQQRDDVPIITEAFKLEAKDLCEDQMFDSSCNDVIDAQKYIESCIMDAVTTGTHDFAPSHREAFLNDCYKTTDQLLKSTDEDDVAYAAEIQGDNGLGEFPCHDRCKDNTCTHLGCVCEAGFYGPFCEWSL